jgi:putative transposase
MDGKGRATDNIAIERFFRSFKWERLYLMCPETVMDVKSITKEYMHTYNYHRDHQRHQYKTPAEIFFNYEKKAA